MSPCWVHAYRRPFLSSFGFAPSVLCFPRPSPPLSTLLRRSRYGYLARLLPSFRGSRAPLPKPALKLPYFALLKLCLLAVTLVFALVLLPLARIDVSARGRVFSCEVSKDRATSNSERALFLRSQRLLRLRGLLCRGDSASIT